MEEPATISFEKARRERVESYIPAHHGIDPYFHLPAHLGHQVMLAHSDTGQTPGETVFNALQTSLGFTGEYEEGAVTVEAEPDIDHDVSHSVLLNATGMTMREIFAILDYRRKISKTTVHREFIEALTKGLDDRPSSAPDNVLRPDFQKPRKVAPILRFVERRNRRRYRK